MRLRMCLVISQIHDETPADTMIPSRTLPTYFESAASQSEYATSSSSSTYPPVTQMGLDYMHVIQPKSVLAHSQSPPKMMPVRQPTNRNERSSFQFNANTTPSLPSSSVPSQQYVFQQSPISAGSMDSNPRPAKSPRHAAPPRVSSNASYSDFSTRQPTAYAESSEALQQQRETEYFPTSMPMQAWSAAPTTSMYNTMPVTSNVQHYQFPNENYGLNENYGKPEGQSQVSYTWTQE